MEVAVTTRRDLARRGPAAVTPRGFSLIEVLVALAILMIISVGLLPLFTRAVISNSSGAQSTDASNFARSRLEEFVQLEWNALPMLIDGEANTFEEYFSFADRTWKDGLPPAGDPALWTRQTIVRQYGVDALADGLIEPDEAQPGAGGVTPQSVHLKEIEVTVQGGREGGVFGLPRRLTLQTLRFK